MLGLPVYLSWSFPAFPGAPARSLVRSGAAGIWAVVQMGCWPSEGGFTCSATTQTAYISSFISLWRDSFVYAISAFWNLVIFSSWPKVWLIFPNVPVCLGRSCMFYYVSAYLKHTHMADPMSYVVQVIHSLTWFSCTWLVCVSKMAHSSILAYVWFSLSPVVSTSFTVVSPSLWVVAFNYVKCHQLFTGF